MKKETKKRVRNILLIGLAACFLLHCINNALFGNIPGHRDGDELLYTTVSPSGTRTVEVIRHNGGATVCFAIIGITYEENSRERSFFRLYHGYDAGITWIDEDHIFIEARTCGNEMYWKDQLPADSTGLVLDLRGEWYDNGDFGGFGRDENGRIFLHRWWR